MPQGAGQYQVLVDANTGTILYSRQLVDLLTAQGTCMSRTARRDRSCRSRGRGRTTPPFSIQGRCRLVFRPRRRTGLDGDSRNTIGNCVNAHLGDTGTAVLGRTVGGQLVFNRRRPTATIRR